MLSAYQNFTEEERNYNHQPITESFYRQHYKWRVNSVFYVISYDIPDNRRRNQLAKVLKGFGMRVQYSVFEAHLTRSQFEQMKHAVESVIDTTEDSVRYYALCSTCTTRIEVPALGEVTSDPETIVV